MGSFFYFTSPRGVAALSLKQQGLAHGHHLGALQGRPGDSPTFGYVRRLGPSLLQSNATVASYEDEDEDDDEGTVATDVARARARIHRTRYDARAGRPTDLPTDLPTDPRPQGRACTCALRSRPSTSKPSEDARNADKVDGTRRKEARGRREGGHR